jgi:signal peptidase II
VTVTLRLRSGSSWLTVTAVAALTLIVDQLTKWWAVTALADGHVIPVVWTLQLSLHHNTGAAFSMGRDSGWTRFLPLFVLIAVGVIVWRGRASLGRAGAVAVGLIIGGAVGNLMDRALRVDGGGILSGGVVDFIDLQWWPVFNVADMGVVIGGLLFAFVAATTGSRHEDEDEATAGGEDAGPAGAGPSDVESTSDFADADSSS